MEAEAYQGAARRTLDELFGRARRAADAPAVILALSEGASPEERLPWEAVHEAEDIVFDLIGLINSPLQEPTRVRLGLCLYARLSGASFLYDRLFNLLVTAEGESVEAFNFSKFRQWGAMPPVEKRVEALSAKAEAAGMAELGEVVRRMFRADVREAFLTSSYVLGDGQALIKAADGQIVGMPFDELQGLLQMALHLHAAYRACELAAMAELAVGAPVQSSHLQDPLADEIANLEWTLDYGSAPPPGSGPMQAEHA